MDIKQEELDIFKASANRMRWFISTAVLISVLILLHMYLEKFSFQDTQLEGIEAHRILSKTLQTQNCYKELIELEAPATKKWSAGNEVPDTKKASAGNEASGAKKANNGNEAACSPGKIEEKDFNRLRSLSYDELVCEYSSRAFQINMTNNTISAVKMPTRQIPILGTDIPANDFVVVMALMSMVFVVGIWLNLRGVHASLTSLEKHGDPDVMRLAQLNTVFLTALENHENTFALSVRACSLWLPFISIVMATVVGYIEPVQDLVKKSDSYAGSTTTIVVFILISLLISVLHFLIAIRCWKVMREIDEIFKPGSH